jgi:hypothetical protein
MNLSFFYRWSIAYTPVSIFRATSGQGIQRKQSSPEPALAPNETKPKAGEKNDRVADRTKI